MNLGMVLSRHYELGIHESRHSVLGIHELGIRELGIMLLSQKEYICIRVQGGIYLESQGSRRNISGVSGFRVD